MERFTISKSEKQTIYEIYRACRICGAGGGYRMPIIQNIIDLDSSEVELRQKIQECLQLEVRPDDRMPPLICELCVDKLNDFYKFLEISRQTNIKTRTRLGLPIQDTKKDPELSNCILGVTEPVYAKDDEPQKKSKPGPRCSRKIKKEPDVVIVKTENVSDSSRSSSVSSRTGRATRRAPSPSPASPPAPSLPAPSPAPAPRPRGPLVEPLVRRIIKPTPKTKETRESSKTKEAPKNKEAPINKEAAKNKEAPINREASQNKEAPKTYKNMQTPKEKKAGSYKKKGELQSLLEDSMKFDDSATSLLMPRSLKRAREEPPRPALLPKRAKPTPTKELVKEPSPPRRPGPKSKQQVKEPSPPRTRPGPKSKKTKIEKEDIPVPLKVLKPKAKPETPKAKEPPEEPPLPPEVPFKCVVCDAQCKNPGGFGRHMQVHTPTYTKIANACNPCGTWYVTVEEAATHHRYHGAATFPYHCRRCFDDFRTLLLYDEHLEKGLCVGDEPPSVKCDDCSSMFSTEALRSAHKCSGRAQGARPRGKCGKCFKTYANAKTLKKHESQCSQKRKGGDLVADPDVLRRLKPMQVRITKCDGLLRLKGDHYDVSRVKPTYGLAKNYIYPYMKLPPVRIEPSRNTIALPATVNQDLFTHWDSDSDVEDQIIRNIPSLSTLTIKKLFSKNLLGKVPRKRKDKYEDFDNGNGFGDVSRDINDIISSLDGMGNAGLDSKDLTAKIKDIIGCLDSDVSDCVMNETAIESLGDTVENMDANENDETTEENHDENNIISNESHCETDEIVDANDETTVDLSQDVNDAVLNNDSSKMEVDNDEITKVIFDESKDNENCEESSNVEVNLGVDTNSIVLESKELTVGNNKINRLDSDTENNPDTNNIDVESLQITNEDISEAALDNRESENIPGNGMDDHANEHSFEDNSKNDLLKETIDTELKSNEVNDTDKTEEVKQKESPIKHSIENLIGETDKNPDKYINEVISSIENIIMNNPRNEEVNTNHEEQSNGHSENEINHSNIDAFDKHIGEKRISDQDKITLEDLMPEHNKHEELENISDDDFNFDI